jgi:hypothetical protein
VFIFVNKKGESWEEKFDNGYFNKNAARFIAARLQIAYGGKYSFIVRPNAYVPPTLIGEALRQSDILNYIESIINPKEEKPRPEPLDDEDEYTDVEGELEFKAQEPEERFLDPEFEKFDYYENYPNLEDCENDQFLY